MDEPLGLVAESLREGQMNSLYVFFGPVLPCGEAVFLGPG
jgi:hypothetical protein